MFYHSKPEADYEMHHPRRAEDSDDWMNKGFDDMRSRHPMFRMPNWTSEDDDVSNLASRMSHSPHFPSMMARRGGPWRERRSSGGPAEGDHVDGHHSDRSNAVRIPIRIEAEAPPGCQPHPPQPPQPQEQPQPHVTNTDPQVGCNQLRKQPQYASRTTSDMDSVNTDELPRNARSSSAPPDMSDKQNGARFVSKTQITPHNPTEALRASPVFNNVAKPFVSAHKAQEPFPIPEEQVTESAPKQPQPQQHPQHEQFSHQQYPHAQHQHPQPEHQHPHAQYQHPQQEPQHPHAQYQHPQQEPQHPHAQYQHPQQEPQHPHHYSRDEQHPHEQHPHWDASGQRPGVIRNIPIIFEGRKAPSSKEPSGPGVSPPRASSHAQHPGRSYWDSSFDDPRFGFGPSHGFSGSDPFFDFPRSSQHHPAFEHRHQQTHPDQQYHAAHPQHQEKQPQPHHSQQKYHTEPQQSHPHPQSQPQQHPQPQQPPKQATPPPAPKDIKMEKIAAVREHVMGFQDLVNNFNGKSKNKDFVYLDEMLTRALIQLDNIDPDGRDDLRQARRSLIKDINNMISSLEKKIAESQETPSNDPSSAPSADAGLQDQGTLPPAGESGVNQETLSQDCGKTSEQNVDTQSKVEPPAEEQGVGDEQMTETGEQKAEATATPEPAAKTEPSTSGEEKMDIDTASAEKKEAPEGDNKSAPTIS